MERSVVALDIGTTKICTLVAEVGPPPENSMRIVGVGTVPSKGIRKGVVVNVGEVTSAITESLQLAERTSGYEIASAYVGLAGAHISAINSHGVVPVSRGERGIHPVDVERALEAARAIDIPHNREILHIIPRSFKVDDDDGVRDPIGMQAYRLEVEAHIVTGATSSIQNLVKCVQNSGIEIDALVLEPLASGESVLTDIEREMGVVLVDIGGGTTDIAIFIEGAIWHAVILPTGGEQLTNDVAVGLRTPFSEAEQIKLKFGHALPDSVRPQETVTVTMFGGDGNQEVSRQFLSEIVEARTEEIFEMVLKEIKRSGYDGLLPAGVVLAGGTAELPGIRDLARDVLGLPARTGDPQNLQGLVDSLQTPAFATTVGLLEWGIKHDVPTTTRQQFNTGLKIPAWLKAILPR
ncbi:cell division protein FtsA [Anaerolineales bacterium HSG6]|nr:cell division protein FtsA [Anaerolineales bacterium HSG6]MDM8529639.1 cell division protein FtsA [Anaerolineales bacterium HSG25]